MTTMKPITDTLGAIVTGVAGSRVATPAAADIAAALDRYGVLVFPELFISDDDLVAFEPSPGHGCRARSRRDPRPPRDHARVP